MIATTISATAICKAAGVSYRSLDYWIRAGAIVPSLPAEGSGSRRGFTEREQEAIVLIGQVQRDCAALGLTMSTETVGNLWTELTRDGRAFLAQGTVAIAATLESGVGNPTPAG